ARAAGAAGAAAVTGAITLGTALARARAV
ncbi:MAG: hypothetical protein KR126chlam3_00426, partial [Chlamydiae bacterium]|nr:hypothetical protein [Chlamydiota bacterium]